MNEATVIQLISTSGAAAALVWVVWLLVTGKLHTDSELKSRDDLIADLKDMNSTVVTRLNQTNEILEKVVSNGYAAAASGGREAGSR